MVWVLGGAVLGGTREFLGCADFGGGVKGLGEGERCGGSVDLDRGGCRVGLLSRGPADCVARRLVSKDDGMLVE